MPAHPPENVPLQKENVRALHESRPFFEIFQSKPPCFLQKNSRPQKLDYAIFILPDLHFAVSDRLGRTRLPTSDRTGKKRPGTSRSPHGWPRQACLRPL
jgi:hypothetical protein